MLRIRVSFGGAMSWIWSQPRVSWTAVWRSALQITFNLATEVGLLKLHYGTYFDPITFNGLVRVTIMDQAMTIQEIEAQYGDEWVLVGNPETDEGLRVCKGQVICHSNDRDEVYRQVVALRLPDYAVLYTGHGEDA